MTRKPRGERTPLGMTGTVFAETAPDPFGIKTLEDNPKAPVDYVWVLVCGFLVMFMQAGFAMVETGFCRAKNATNLMAKNTIDLIAGSLGFFAVGYVFLKGTDVGGFIVTRLFTPFLLGAVRMLEAGIATRDEIDISMKFAVNHPMGPLEVVDFIGLDTELSIANSLYEETKDPKYAPPLLLVKMVTAGWLGRKSGKGFYDYK